MVRHSPYSIHNPSGLLRLRIVLLIFTAVVLLPLHTQAQALLYREISLSVSPTDTLVLPDRFIYPASFRVYAADSLLPSELYTLKAVPGLFIWHYDSHPPVSTDSLYFRYAYWPLGMSDRVALRELEYLPAEQSGLPARQTPAQATRSTLTREELFAGSRLERSGSLQRGIVFGSARDATMDSGLRFNASGSITEDLHVRASLTDRSTPIQPDGTTRVLREFDQVYIHLSHTLGELHMGDVDLELKDSEFALLRRRMQGVTMHTDMDRSGVHQAAAAVARGRFRSMQFNGEDARQGPYRLTGQAGNPLIIVLAGTEQVYLNGRLLVRGEENDYVIDYGLGEITFTSNRIITDHTRITVDFEYMTEEYTRTTLAAQSDEVHLAGGRLALGASVVREADNINLSTHLFLTDAEREVLRSAGNDPSLAVVSGADSVGYRRDADFLLYALRDTVYAGSTYEIYEHRPGDPSGVYRVTFSRVGEGEGDYRRAGRAANGVLYEWVGPGNGRYMPQRRLPVPREQSMLTLRGRFEPTSRITVASEWVTSHLDQNRFSSIGNRNNSDMALFTSLSMRSPQTVLGQFDLQIQNRYEGRHFAYFDRAREVEFGRRWNVGSRTAANGQQWDVTGGWVPREGTSLRAGAGFLERPDFEGRRADLHLVSEQMPLPGLDYYLELVQSDDQLSSEKGTWIRQQGRIDYSLAAGSGYLLPSLEFEHEDRRQKETQTGALLPVSNQFVEAGPALYYERNDALRLGAQVRYRQDKGISQGQLVNESTGLTSRYEVRYQHGTLFDTRQTLSFRNRTFSETFRVQEQRKDSRGVLLRSVTNWNPWNGFVRSRLLYDANTERRPIMQEAFFEAGPELGQYVWIDLNNDGVQQVDEFFPEQHPYEGTFVKQFIPSEELFPVIALRMRAQLVLDPSELIDPYDARFSERLQFLSGIRWQVFADIREENSTTTIQDIYLLRMSSFQNDSLTIRGSSHLGQELELFRNDTRREFRVSSDHRRGQNQQANGLETRRSDRLFLRGSGRLSSMFRYSAELELQEQEQLSQAFRSRNYAIRGYRAQPGLEARWSQAFRSTAAIALTRKLDSYPENVTRVDGLAVSVSSHWMAGAASHVTFSLERRTYGMRGGPSTSLGEFEITAGAGLGTSYQWSVRSEYRINDFLRATLQYDGRTITDRPAVQTMRVGMSAIF